MDSDLRTRLGGGAIAAAMTILGPVLVTGSGEAAPASSTGLTPFASCDALLQWYVDHSIGDVGPYGWGGPIMYMEAQPEVGPVQAGRAATDTAQDGVSNGATGTNTQEVGVDEPDVAKTDGRIVVRLQQEQVVITDVSGVAARELATWALPPGVSAEGLLLVDDHVLISTSAAYPVDATTGPYDYARATRTELYDLDVSTPSAPRLVGHTSWSGTQLSLRQYGDTVRLVTSTGRPDLPFVQPSRNVSQAEATTRNREVVRESTIEQWLPSVRSDGSTRRAVDCSRIYHPSTSSTDGDATVGVFTLHAGDTAPASAVAVTGNGSDVYSSDDRLYVWSTDWRPPLRLYQQSRSLIRPMVRPRTVVHAFALDGDETRYVASGMIDGQVRDRWSFDEHEGHLRVAVTWPRRFPTSFNKDDVTTDSTTGDNGIVVLDEQGGRLVEVGELRGLGRDEQIQAVRWFGDLAVLVTFRQMDPLFTIDLSDPEQPRELGALELPGLLLLPAPDRRRPAARTRHRRDDAGPVAGGQGRGVRHLRHLTRPRARPHGPRQ